MRTPKFLCSLPLLLLIHSPFAQTAAPLVRPDYGKLPLSFETNRGQADPQVKFLSRGNGYSLFLTDGAAVLSLNKGATPPETSSRPASAASHSAGKTDILSMQVAGASLNSPMGEQELPGITNYFIGSDPAKWHSSIPNYGRVRYTAVYPGVDLIYYGNQRQLEYDFVVAPGADASAIRLHFAGARKLRLAADGELAVIAENGAIKFHKPVVYQTLGNRRQPVDGSFQLAAGNTITFKLGSYDHARELVIDPTLEYSTYLGSTGSDSAQGIAVDSAGATYVTGYTYSTKFPTTSGSHQPTSTYTTNTNLSAVFVSKLNAAGTALLYSTYLAGTADHCNDGTNYNATTQGDFGNAIALDESGNAYITGGTCANDFPTTTGAFQTTSPGNPHHATNAFITRLNPTGSALIYSTYLGGSGILYSGDFAFGIAVDSSENAYVTGQTSSTDFPVTKGAYQTTNPNAFSRDSAFVTKINPKGTALVYSTYLGGSGIDVGELPGDSGQAIAINASGNAYVTGYSYSSNFPVTSGVFQATNKAFSANGSNAFVTEMNTTGTGLVFSTYLGGTHNTADPNYDSGNGIALDSEENIYIGGGTSSPNFPVTSSAYQSKNKNTEDGANAVVTKLNPTGTKLVYSTYVGGTGHANCGGDRALALAVDSLGDAFFTGYTCSNNYPATSGAYQTSNKGYANTSEVAFLTELNPNGTALLYSTYFGGAGTTANPNGDIGNALAFSDGNVYFAGATESTNFPVSSSAYQKANKAASGKSNAFIAHFAFSSPTTTSVVTDGNPQKLGVKATFTADIVPSTGTGTPTGTVDFSVDGGAAIAEALDDTGHAAYSTSSLAEGTHTIKASYVGDATHLASTSAVLTETIYGAASAVTVVSGSGQTSPVGTAFSLPLVVVVKDAKGDVIPGVVVTYSGTGLKFSSTTATTNSSGQASVTATPTTTGSLKATATTGGKSVTFTLTATGAAVATPSVSQTITISDATSGATVYYTTNGSTPTTSSTKYTGPITITASETLKFIAVHSGDSNSAVRTVTDTIN